jgi:hypothetical protein
VTTPPARAENCGGETANVCTMTIVVVNTSHSTRAAARSRNLKYMWMVDIFSNINSTFFGIVYVNLSDSN